MHARKAGLALLVSNLLWSLENEFCAWEEEPATAMPVEVLSCISTFTVRSMLRSNYWVVGIDLGWVHRNFIRLMCPFDLRKRKCVAVD